MPACFIFTPAAIPPNPAPTTTTLGVPAGPNSSSAVDFTGTCWSSSCELNLAPCGSNRGEHASLDRKVDPVDEARLVGEQERHGSRHFLGVTLAAEGRVLDEH